MNDQGAMIYDRNCTTLDDLELHEEWADINFGLLQGCEVEMVEQMSRGMAENLYGLKNESVGFPFSFREVTGAPGDPEATSDQLIIRRRGIYSAYHKCLFPLTSDNNTQFKLRETQFELLSVDWFTRPSWMSLNRVLLRKYVHVKYNATASAMASVDNITCDTLNIFQKSTPPSIDVELLSKNGKQLNGRGNNYLEALISAIREA